MTASSPEDRTFDPPTCSACSTGATPGSAKRSGEEMLGVKAELDVSRLTELRELLGTEIPLIVRTLMTELTDAVARIEAGLQSGDLSEAAAAAHAGRNSALMIDAQPVLGLLKQIETCARRDERDGALAAQAELGQAWPRLRSQLERAAEGRG